MVLLVDVVVLDLRLLLDGGAHELFVHDHDTPFADCLQHDVTLAFALGRFHDVLESLELQIVYLYLLAELENNWLVQNLPVVVHQFLRLS